MTIPQALVLGVVQGLTEFIPISSTAHLLIGQYLLGIEGDGQVFAFQVIVQLGTVLALLIFFRRDFWQMLQACWNGIRGGRPFASHEARLAWLIVLASLPALVVGFVVKDVVEEWFSSPTIHASARLLLSAALLATAELWRRPARGLQSMSWMDALIIGLFQVLAVFPGASRSGSTIAGGMSRGIERASAARFALLLSAPVLLAAGAYEVSRVIELPGTHAFLPHLLTGFGASTVVGWLAIRWLMGYLNRHSLALLAGYCAVVGLLVLLFPWAQS